MKHISSKEIWTYFITVFITGCAVLIIEVAAVRQLTPVFGGSIYVLSSVLSVILLALSIGYFCGGRLADRYPNHNVLYHVITASGLSMLLLQFGSILVLGNQIIFSLITGPILIALAFFFIPAVLLGMDSPYVIKLITLNSSESESGKYVGTTFFWSTIGSITGSLAAGFWLIPHIGVQASITYTSVALVILGIVAPIVLTNDSRLRYISNKAVYILTAIAIAVVIISQINRVSAPQSNVLFQTDGLYSKIVVKETTHEGRATRSLHRDTNNSSAIFIDSYDHVFAYSQFVNFYDDLVAEPDNFLLIGGGAYSIPRRLVVTDPDILVDVVEIEPILYTVAQKYFDLGDTSRITNYVTDARMFLAKTEKKYDVIFSDAFSSALAIPWQLGTTEFYEDIRSVLNPEGVIIINYIGLIDTTPGSMTSVYINTVRESFPYLAMYKSQARADSDLQNIMLIASETPINKAAIESYIIDTKGNGSFTVGELEYDLTAFDLDNETIFTDNEAPIEYLSGQQLRKALDQ